MKPALTKPLEAPQTPFVIRKRVAKPQVPPPSPTVEKRDNIFSKSRDTREDRGSRQMKTTHKSQTLSPGR